MAPFCGEVISGEKRPKQGDSYDMRTFVDMQSEGPVKRSKPDLTKKQF
jgi:hypothetical protein